MIKIQQLRYFIAVVKHNGFRSSTKETLRTQAALSQSIRALEETLGQKLFDKKNKLALTPYGKMCLPKIHSFLEHYATLQTYMHEMAKGNYGQLRIGCTPSIVQKILPKILPNYTMLYPDIKVSLQDDTSEQIYQKLINGTIDIAISI